MILFPITLKHNFLRCCFSFKIARILAALSLRRAITTTSILKNNSSLSKEKDINKLIEIRIGFLDGDGYFDIGAQKQYNKNPNNQPKSTIKIRLGTNLQIKEKELLELIIKKLGVFCPCALGALFLCLQSKSRPTQARVPCLCAAGISCVAFCLPCLCAAPLPVTQEVTGGISCVASVKSKGSVPLVSSPSGSAGWAYSPASSKSKGGKIDYSKSKNQYRLILYKKDILNFISFAFGYATQRQKTLTQNCNNIEFLVYNRRKQYFLLKYILENNIKHWEPLLLLLAGLYAQPALPDGLETRGTDPLLLTEATQLMPPVTSWVTGKGAAHKQGRQKATQLMPPVTSWVTGKGAAHPLLLAYATQRQKKQGTLASLAFELRAKGALPFAFHFISDANAKGALCF
jgi:hypothetical protein